MSDNLLVNTTPHSIRLVHTDGSETEYPSAKDSVLRLAEAPVTEWDMAHDVLTHPPATWSGLEWSKHLPEHPEGVNVDLLVSMVVGEYIRARGIPDDWAKAGIVHVYGPDTSGDKAVRNSSGQVVGCRQLIRYL